MAQHIQQAILALAFLSTVVHNKLILSNIVNFVFVVFITLLMFVVNSLVLTNANLLTCSHCSNYGANCYQFCFSSSVSYQETLISVLRVLLALLSEVCMGL